MTSQLSQAPQNAEASTVPQIDGPDSQDDGEHSGPMRIIYEYLIDRVPEFGMLVALRKKGWKNPAGNEFFRKKRENADKSRDNPSTARNMYQMMKLIAKDMQGATGAFRVLSSSNQPRILDLCSAPGGFLEIALGHASHAQATAFSLTAEEGGYDFMILENPRVNVKLMDITMLAADMGVTSISSTHPDHDKFLPRGIPEGKAFDLVICDGNVSRTQIRSKYREGREATRLTNTQLALGLEHLAPGGTMVILLHKVEAWQCVLLLKTMEQFATIQLYKHPKFHAARSSFYLVATKVNSRYQQARKAIEQWRETWKVATFGTEEEYKAVMRATDADAKDVLEEYGQRLADIGRPIWDVQVKALGKAPFIKGR